MNVLQKIFILFLSLFIIFVYITENKSKNIFASIEKKFTIPIEYNNLEKTYPEYWLEKPINAKVELLNLKNNEELLKIQKALEDALSAYPLSLLKKNLRSIGIANKLFFYDTPYGATYTKTLPKNSLYLSVDTENNMDIYHYVLDSFHHEFSSILMIKYPFPEQTWRQSNPSDFVYRYEHEKNPGLEAIKNNMSDTSTPNSENLHSKGFLSEYSMTSVQEDVNVFSGVIFIYPEWMLSLSKKNPPIKKKLKIWLQYYLSIDSTFIKTKLFKYFKDNGLI